jgi:hypothetical protein
VVRATRAAKAQAEGLVAAARRQCDERVAAAQATAAECASSTAAQLGAAAAAAAARQRAAVAGWVCTQHRRARLALVWLAWATTAAAIAPLSPSESDERQLQSAGAAPASVPPPPPPQRVGGGGGGKRLRLQMSNGARCLLRQRARRQLCACLVGWACHAEAEREAAHRALRAVALSQQWRARRLLRAWAGQLLHSVRRRRRRRHVLGGGGGGDDDRWRRLPRAFGSWRDQVGLSLRSASSRHRRVHPPPPVSTRRSHRLTPPLRSCRDTVGCVLIGAAREVARCPHRGARSASAGAGGCGIR